MTDRPIGDETDQELRLVMTDLADAAPPAPDYELISSPYSATHNGKVSEMSWTRWIVAGAGAAAVLVLVIVGVAVANTSDDDEADTAAEGSTATTAAPSTDTEPASEAPLSEAPVSDLELATQFLDDLHSLDTEATVAVMADDAIVSYLDVSRADDIPGLQSMMQARDWEFTADNCVEVAGRGGASGDDSTTRVECDVTFEDAVSKAAGFEPYPGSVVTVWVEDGAVTLLTLEFEWRRHYPEVAAPFRVWLSETHPDDVRVMTVGSDNHPAVTPESVALWEQYTAEYIAETYG